MSEEQAKYAGAGDGNKKEALPVEVRAKMLQNETSIYFNLVKFEHAQRIASLFSASTMVPQHFQGNVANCLIALNYADRLQADPFMVMQNMYVVHGRPGIEAKLVIALINQSGKYSEPLKFRFDGAGDDYGCTAWTREAKSQEIVDGPKVTWKMVKSEGWDSKTGTKWKTIPDLMFRYRAASWFANTNCPELKLGMQTIEEIHDFVELQESKAGAWSAPEPPNQAVPLPPWSEAIGLDTESPEFLEFVRVTLQANRTTEAELRKSANNNPAHFVTAFNSWMSKRSQQHQDPRQRKPRSDKGQPRKPAEAQPEDPAPEPKLKVKDPEKQAEISPEESETNALRALLQKYESTHKYHVLEAKKRTGIAHPASLDGYRRLVECVEEVIEEKNG